MRTYWSLGDLPLGGPRRVVAIGTFDGVHLGHQEVIAQARERARQRDLPLMVVTFEPNPVAVLRPELSPAVLTPVEMKSALIGALNVDELLVIPFTRAFARIRAERFVEMLRAAPIGADTVVVGRNFRFGFEGAGTIETFEKVGRAGGLETIVPEIVTSSGDKPVSSTRIRRLIAGGNVREAAALLTRPHNVEGPVVDGAKRGRQMGVPTANIDVPTSAATPARGVYAGLVATAAGRWPAAINVGFAPTFAEGPSVGRPKVEAYLLDYEGDAFYGVVARVVFLDRLRDEQRFDDPAELVAQIGRDVSETRRIVAESGEASATVADDVRESP